MIKRKTAMEFNVTKHLFTENEDSYLYEIIQDTVFLERILLNSESLYNKLKKIVTNNKKIDDKTRKSLVKYLLRMAARPQPNRLNSGICLDQADAFNDKNQFKKAEISLEWEYKLMQKLENSLTMNSDIKVVLNPTLYKKDRQYILEKSMKGNKSYVYVNDSDFLDILFESLKNPTSLKSILEEYNEEAHKKLVLGVVEDLIKKDVIKTELSSYSINRDSEAFIRKLKQCCNEDEVLISKLDDIQVGLERYRAAEIGEGIEIYKDLTKKMASLCKSSSYLIVDLYIYDTMNEKKEVTNNVNVDESLKIMQFFNKHQAFDWKEYHNIFVGKYGSFTKVPLLQMIDRDIGIGLPKYSPVNNTNKKIEEYLLNRIMQSNFLDGDKLKLSSNDFSSLKRIYGDEGEDRIPTSYDCKLVSCEDQLLLPPNAFSFPRHSFTGRFSLSEKETPISQPNFSEVNYVSNYFKDLGLTHKSESSTFIDCTGRTDNTVNRIPLNEINVTAHNNRFYLTYKDETVYPVSTHLFGYRNFNEHPAAVFLNEFYRYCFEYPSDFPVDSFSYLEFIPRIEYEDFILSPARVNIKFNLDSTEEERLNKINQIIDKYELNKLKYIYLLEGDRSLPVPNNNNPAISFLESCKRNVGESYELVLMEAPELENAENNDVCDWIYSSSSDLCTNEEHEHKHLKKALEVSRPFLDETDPNVSSYYLYYRNGKREKIEQFILKLNEDGVNLENLFIVNFIDENNREHIRLRYKKDYKNDIELEKRLVDLITSGDLYDYKKTLFHPEINRYGGKDVYEKVYKLFSVDTTSIGKIKSLYSNYNEIERALYLSSYALYGLLGDDTDLLYEYLENSISKNPKYVKPFSKRRNEFRKIVLQSLQDYEKEFDELSSKHKSLSKEVLRSINKAGISKEELFYLIRSIIHMSMNRHFPFKRDLEEEASQYMRFAFSNISYYLRGVV
ncbi:thiopeptide-type bacteriocin biosynthesis protein [Halobacillus litoralis]|uniref:thiopeptide-type bacteriocin biosynthesis protein n=1 Tax=Halobacillus litoralis TaxID=45668 RepID=UPI0013687372|nr:thiopeptide-type bacteriocin biosynthesis protein [Halobacillus litoralis]MYL39809.1 hypothetical protein [Halobacillus litoralis]